MPERVQPTTAERIEWVREDLVELGVADPARFVPDGDKIAAAVVDYLLKTDDYKLPSFEDVNMGLWLLSMGINIDEETEIQRFQELYQQLYLDDAFHKVLEEKFRRYQAEEREQDARWWAEVAETLEITFQRIDLIKLFGSVESETTKVKPGAGITDLGVARKFIEQKYPLVTPGVLITFVFSAGAIIDAGRGAELDELMCERLLVASTPQILGRNAVIYADRHQVMGNIGGRLAQKYLELSHEEISLIQTAPLKPEHQEILASMRSV